MIERLVNFALREKFLVIIATVLLVVFGAYSFQKLPIDAFPDVTNIQVQIITQAQGMSPLEVEKFVTFPIEIQMSGLPRLVELRSRSKPALSLITVVFEDGVDIYFARQLVLERLIEAKEKLPPSAEPALGPVSTGLGEIFQYTLESLQPGHPEGPEHLMELRTYQDWMVRPILKSVPGVADVNSFGGFVRQYHVIVDPDKLRKFGLSLREVFEVVAKNNANVGGNILEHASEQYLVRGVGLVTSLRDIEEIVVKEHGNVPILVRDVAEVKIGPEVRQGALVRDGKEGVAGIIMMLRGGNAKEVAARVKAKVKDINDGRLLPEGTAIRPFYDRTELVEAAVGTVRKALLEGSVLVILILFLMLGNARSALIVTLSLPLAVLATFILMRLPFINLSANLMTLGGLAIAIGMMVDGSVVMVENIYRHLTEKRPATSHEKLEIVRHSALEVARPVLFGIGIIIIVFLPLFSLRGIEGKMFTPLASTISLSLFSSIVIALLIAPVLSFLLLKAGKEEEVWLIRAVKKVYLPALHAVLRHRVKTVLVAVVLLAGSLALFPFLGTEFIPSMDEGSITTQMIRLPDISLTQSIRIEEVAHRLIRKFPEVRAIASKIGTAEIATDPEGQNTSDPIVVLKPRREWKNFRSKEKLVDAIRAELEKIPGVALNITQPIALRVDELISGVKSQIAIKIFGDDMKVLKQKAEEIAQAISAVKGVADLRVEQVAGQRYLTVEIDRRKIARFGLNVSDVQEIIEIAVGGKVATEVLEGDRRVDVLVRFPEEKRKSAATIGNILINTPAGLSVPLEQLAQISLQEGPVQISRENIKRRIVVECNVDGRDIGSFVAEAQAKINEKVQLPSGYFVTWGGAFENQQRAMQRLMIIVPAAIGLIFLLLFSAFDSFKQAFIVILNLPFALIGGIVALFISGLYLSVPASVGFIALFGVAVLNGIVLVTFINQLRKEGMMTDIAVVRACSYRLRPVLMTALVTMLGLVPLLFATGVGSEVQRPLAVVVIGGLLSSTALTLFVLPAIYTWWESGKKT